MLDAQCAPLQQGLINNKLASFGIIVAERGELVECAAAEATNQESAPPEIYPSKYSFSVLGLLNLYPLFYHCIQWASRV